VQSIFSCHEQYLQVAEVIQLPASVLKKVNVFLNYPNNISNHASFTIVIEELGYVWLGGRDTQGTCQIIKFGCNEVYGKANITAISTKDIFSFMKEMEGGGVELYILCCNKRAKWESVV